MDGIIYLLNQAGIGLSLANSEIERLNGEISPKHIIPSGNDWTWDDASHAIQCDACKSWRKRAFEWVERQLQAQQQATSYAPSADNAQEASPQASGA